MAAEPPRPPPRNLLFCGPPPTLPRVLLLPHNSLPHDQDNSLSVNANDKQTNDSCPLHEINNVGVPLLDDSFTYDVGDHVYEKSVIENTQNLVDSNCYLRRIRSFNSVDNYICVRTKNDFSNCIRNRLSEPDLSKYSLYVETELTVDCVPLHPPPLVLNNPFYNGSFAYDANDINQTMVVLPENYLAFEDSFVPTWNYTQDVPIEREPNSIYYYENMPMTAQSDTWSFGIDNANFEYSPTYPMINNNDNNFQYMPLPDIEYALPEYLNLPVMERGIIENFGDNTEHTNEINLNCINDYANRMKADNIESVPVNKSNAADEDKSVLNNTQSPSRSEESLIADISNDVTSSLAFMPDSFNSQRPIKSADDTSDGTSPCSTDYHEASALDLVQSLDELSCDSNDFSQSRDEVSPPLSDNKNLQLNYDIQPTNKSEGSIPLKADDNLRVVEPTTALSSLQKNDTTLKTLPIANSTEDKIESVKAETSLRSSSLTPTCISETTEKADSSRMCNFDSILVHQETNIQSTKTQCSTNVSVTKSIVNPKPPPRPPAVPTSWLTNKPETPSTSVKPLQPPIIQVQTAETIPLESDNNNSSSSVKPHTASQKSVTAAADPQPSCSFSVAQSSPSAQLKPKEVEVSNI